MKTSEFSVMPIDAIQKQAEEKGCEVVIAAPNQLQFDLDTEQARESFKEFFHVKLYKRYGKFLPLATWKSKSGHDHAVVDLPADLPIEQRIALQAMGGSDPGREFAALCCHWDGSATPVLLYKPKGAK